MTMPSRRHIALSWVLAVAVALGAADGAAASAPESGYPSSLLVRYKTQRLEPREVAQCPGPGIGQPCTTSVLPLEFHHHLRLSGGGSIRLRSHYGMPSPTVDMEARCGHRLGPRLQVIPLDRGRPATDGPVTPGGPVRHYIAHHRWRIQVPGRLPPDLYTIGADFFYPLGGFNSFAFGASGPTEGHGRGGPGIDPCAQPQDSTFTNRHGRS